MNTIKVFVLDDDKYSVTRLSNMLSGLEFIRVVGKETNPARAIPQILSNTPEIVFLDVEMPGINGLALIDKIRCKDYSPVFIVVTGYEKYAIEALRKAAFDYLLKPVDPDELESVLKRFIEEYMQKDENPNPVISLSPREMEVFWHMLRGEQSIRISEDLHISCNTVNTHRRRILHKLNLCSTTELILKYGSGGSK